MFFTQSNGRCSKYIIGFVELHVYDLSNGLVKWGVVGCS